MKNNCDVSGEYPECSEQSRCGFFMRRETNHGTICTYYWEGGFCSNMTAIRAAIEAEREANETR